MQDQLIAPSHWSFDDTVTTVFDDMLRRSIPQYEVMRQSVFDLGCAYVQPETYIVDLGCSRGEALAPFVQRFPNPALGIEVSQPMRDAAKERFINCPHVEVRDTDLRVDYPQEQASLTLCVLTLQFTPIEYRQRILRQIFKQTVSGGALILVEKVLGSTAELDSLMVETYYGLKANNGYTQEQIERKRLSLEGVLVPVTAHWNEELLKTSGFSQIDCFWRWMNFAGWIAVKE